MGKKNITIVTSSSTLGASTFVTKSLIIPENYSIMLGQTEISSYVTLKTQTSSGVYTTMVGKTS